MVTGIKQTVFEILLLQTVLIVPFCFCDKSEFVKIDHIRHYEPVHYDTERLRHQHHVTKRSPNVPIKMEFMAFGRQFKLHLESDKSVHHTSMVVETEQGTQLYHPIRPYRGHLEDEITSRVTGLITKEGHFEGKIITTKESYFIERSKFHIPDITDFHTIIYRLSDVTFNTSLSTCAHDKIFKRQMELYKRKDSERTKQTEESGIHIESTQHSPNHHNKYAESFNIKEPDTLSGARINRRKRAIDPAKVTCELYMQADHTYYQHYDSDVETIIEKMTSYVQAVTAIYQTIDFDSSGSADNIGFIIKKIKIHSDSAAQGYKYPGNYDADYFLNLHSQDNYDDYCLSYLFSYRDFSGGILGLAWIGDLGAVGGVCERHTTLQNVGKSLNTGIVSELNYGTKVPTVVSHITFAHEIAHNFGSPHDPEGDTTCTPGGDTGNYIMYARATSGTKPNNDDLSSCSIASINPILESKARGSSRCFVAYNDQICGNRVVEGTEECDCGWEDECTEGCCNPQVINTTGVETPCTRKSSAVCSPSEGPCCTDSCQFTNNTVLCRESTSCSDNATCGGSSFECPSSGHRANQTECGDANDFQVCYNGECTSSICLAYGRESCQCEPAVAGDWTDTRLCQVCCMDADVCKSSYDLADIPDKEVASGMPCLDFKGYCDVFKKCREVDPSGPLSNLRRLILSGEAIDTLKDFLTEHWYIGLVGGLVLVIIIALVVKFCSKSTNNNKFNNNNPRDTEKPTSSRNDSRGGRNQIEPFGWM